MKKLALASLLLLVQPFAIFATSDKPNPADFTTTVHVISSSVQLAGSVSIQILETVIDNQLVELQREGPIGWAMQALGDYPGRLSPSIHGPKNPNTFDVYRGYDLLMPDGTVRTYGVTDLGPASANP